MQIYSLNGTVAISAGEETFVANEDGSFDLPQGLADTLINTHVGGAKVWETDGERSLRLQKEEEDRKADPKSLYDLLSNALAPQTVPVVTGPGAPEAAPVVKSFPEVPAEAVVETETPQEAAPETPVEKPEEAWTDVPTEEPTVAPETATSDVSKDAPAPSSTPAK